MAKYRKVYSLIWDDEEFQELSGDEQRIVLYCLTGKHTNRIGLFCFSTAEAAETLKIDPARFQELFGNVCRRLEWPYDPKRRVLYIPSWWKWNAPENPNVLKGALEDVLTVPQTPLRETFAANMAYLSERYHDDFRKRLANVSVTFHETLPSTIPPTVPKQEQEQEQEHVTKQQHVFAAAEIDQNQIRQILADLDVKEPSLSADSSKPASLIMAAIAVLKAKQQGGKVSKSSRASSPHHRESQRLRHRGKRRRRMDSARPAGKVLMGRTDRAGQGANRRRKSPG